MSSTKRCNLCGLVDDASNTFFVWSQFDRPWKVGPDLDFCPECAKKVEVAIESISLVPIPKKEPKEKKGWF